MSRRFTIHACHICGRKDFEENMLEYNDRMFCGIRCKLKQERKDDENLARPMPRSVGDYDKG